MAPEATVVAVKVAGRNGAVDVSTMLQAMHWVSAYKDQFGIRVLNLSWGTDSTQDPAVDPLNHAVQRLWQQGIVVVVAAGNSGPHAGTITKPGDDPMVLTVGAYDDKGDIERPQRHASRPGPRAARRPPGWPSPTSSPPAARWSRLRSPGSRGRGRQPQGARRRRLHQGLRHLAGRRGRLRPVGPPPRAAPDLDARPGQARPDLDRQPARRRARAPTQGAGRVQLAAALTADPGPACWQVPTATGLGSLEASRGGSHVEVVCPGRRRAPRSLAARSTPPARPGTARSGPAPRGPVEVDGLEVDRLEVDRLEVDRLDVDRWRVDRRRLDRRGVDRLDAWTGSAWTGSTWTGSKWTGSTWTGSNWTGSKWTGSKWTGSKWTGSKLDQRRPRTGDVTHGDDFLTAFWGQDPQAGLIVPGETSDAE